MKARAITMMAAAMTAMSAFAQEQVADKLVLDGYEGGSYSSNEITVSDIDGLEIYIYKESVQPYQCSITSNLTGARRGYSLFSFN